MRHLVIGDFDHIFLFKQPVISITDKLLSQSQSLGVNDALFGSFLTVQILLTFFVGNRPGFELDRVTSHKRYWSDMIHPDYEWILF